MTAPAGDVLSPGPSKTTARCTRAPIPSRFRARQTGKREVIFRRRRARRRPTHDGRSVAVSRSRDDAEAHGQYIFDSRERYLQLQVYIEDTGFRITAIHVRLSASMLRRILILLLFPRLFAATVSSGVTYAKVSKNGQLARSSHDSPFPWISRCVRRGQFTYGICPI